MMTQRKALLAVTIATFVFSSLMTTGQPDESRGAETATDVGGVKKKEDKVKAEAHLAFDKLVPGQECRILVRLSIQSGWHINSNPPKPKDFVPTEVTIKGKHGTVLEQIQYPKGKSIQMQDQDDPVSVYDGKVDLFGKLKVPAEAAGKTEEMEIVVRYQACNDQTCLLPATTRLTGKIPVAKIGETAKPINQSLFKDERTSE